MNNIDHDTIDIEKIKLNKLEELWKSLIEIQIELVDEDMTDDQMDQELKSYKDKYIKLKLIGKRALKDHVKSAVTDNLDQATGVMNDARRRTNDNHVRS